MDTLELDDFELERELLLELDLLLELAPLEELELEDDALEEDELLEPLPLDRAIFFATLPLQVRRTLSPTEIKEQEMGALALFSHSTDASIEQVSEPTEIEVLLYAVTFPDTRASPSFDQAVAGEMSTQPMSR